MEILEFELRPGADARAAGNRPPVLVGVVASGNLEVLVEQVPATGSCTVEVNTAAAGFETIWQAVLDDFISRHPLTDVRLSINDVGATPAVVSLRLDQAIEAFLEAQI
jgi:malonate decarboxylase delta subunit